VSSTQPSSVEIRFGRLPFQGNSKGTFAQAMRNALWLIFQRRIKCLPDTFTLKYRYRLFAGEADPKLSWLDSCVAFMTQEERNRFALALFWYLTSDTKRKKLQEVAQMFEAVS
jgi:hypothetical protein